jgi:hypothetical protein
MSLPARQRRALSRIEKALAADERFRSRFAIFTSLTVNEAMPGTEHVSARSRWLLLRELVFRPGRCGLCPPVSGAGCAQRRRRRGRGRSRGQDRDNVK